MKKIAVIGGGLAGLSAAVFLSALDKFETHIFEASPKPGGRAYSFLDNLTNDVIDNGQHIMMGCYTDTLDFLKLIGAFEKIYIQPKLEVNFVDKRKGITPLSAKSNIYPFNLLLGLLSYQALSMKDRLRILSLLSKLIFIREESFYHLSVMEWLKRNNQSQSTIKAFWEILAVGALNSDLRKASAAIFISILKQMFLAGNKASAIILPATGLSQMYCDEASEYLSAHNGCLHLNEPIKSIAISNNKVINITTKEKVIKDFDYVISAVPAYAFERILPEAYRSQFPFRKIKYTSILSAHLWLRKNLFVQKFYGLIDSPLHWVFNHGDHITTVVSNADYLLNRTKDEILQLIIHELKSYFNFFSSEDISSYKIIKEKRATFIPENEFLMQRPEAITIINNLFLAGDWTNTGLPATIEGAVKSGRVAAEKIIAREN